MCLHPSTRWCRIVRVWKASVATDGSSRRGKTVKGRVHYVEVSWDGVRRKDGVCPSTHAR